MQSSDAIRAVVFDVGCTLVDETRSWAAWADYLGVPAGTFMGVLGSVIERGEHHRRAFEIISPGIDVDVERKARAFDLFNADDLYPDVVPCFERLREQGYLIGCAGNMPQAVEDALVRMGVRPDVLGSSERWGVEKPARAFFERIVAECGREPGEIAYIGDRLDNDVLPALDEGLIAIHIRRGPWGYVHALRPEVGRAHARIDTLAELPGLLPRLPAA